MATPAPETGEVLRVSATFAPDHSGQLGVPAEYSAPSLGSPAMAAIEDAGSRLGARRQLEAGCAAEGAGMAFEAMAAAEALEALEAAAVAPPPPPSALS